MTLLTYHRGSREERKSASGARARIRYPRRMETRRAATLLSLLLLGALGGCELSYDDPSQGAPPPEVVAASERMLNAGAEAQEAEAQPELEDVDLDEANEEPAAQLEGESPQPQAQGEAQAAPAEQRLRREPPLALEVSPALRQTLGSRMFKVLPGTARRGPRLDLPAEVAIPVNMPPQGEAAGAELQH